MKSTVLIGAGTCFLSIGLLVPTLPRYVTGPLGQSFGMVGLAAALPSVAAILARPFAGRVVDRRTPRSAAAAGAITLAIATLGLLAADSMPALLVCRVVAGVGEALVYVGFAAAAVSEDHGAPTRVTWFSVAVYAGLLLGAPIGEVLRANWGFPAVWIAASLAALAAAGCAFTLPATNHSRADKVPLVHRAGLLPGIAYAASVWGYTTFNTFIPLYVAELGGRDAQVEYLVYGAVLLGVRVLGHRVTERFSARRTGVVSLVFTAVGLLVLVVWPRPPGLVSGTTLLAVGQALGLPAFLTTAINAVPASQRGSVLATVTAFFDVGYLTSALSLGAVNQLFGLWFGFATAAVISTAAAVLLASVVGPGPPVKE
ncbi:MFS transporter [Actinocrispum wychmicini]|uniref:Putative MFS family arabinose efflux permease n=1 Tax=Actinocrispum wychmicini TaxID=1213861 RepID=A0A4R2JML7_9PSEU|nr:MFS transporter [Actinocrispum wychmicini]TCO58348.1 putative MFS family arabinose efflux permease [Actinocrispum wychmicini]